MFQQFQNLPGGIAVAILVVCVVVIVCMGAASAAGAEGGGGRKSRRELDPRLKSLMVGRSPFERLLIALVGKGMDAESVSEVFDDAAIGDASSGDMNEAVAGKPYHHWLGKTQEDIEREVDLIVSNEGGDENKAEKRRDDMVEEILSAFEDRGVTIAETPVETTTAVTSEAIAAAGGGPGKRSATPTGPLVTDDAGEPARAAPNANEQGEQDPTFGDDQIPLSELAGKSEEDLLKIDGIGPKTVEKIRELEAAKKK